MTGRGASLRPVPFAQSDVKESESMKPFSKAGVAAALLAAFAALPLHASAALFDDNEARKAILDLRAKVEQLQNDLNTRLDTKADKSAMLDLINTHDQTMQEIAKLRGVVEVLANDVSNLQKRQKDLYTDLDARLRKVEPQQVTIDGKQEAVQQAEQNSYDAALGQFKSGDYKGAASALDAFVRQYPASAYAANAQYWLGNAYYAQRDCKGAIAAQQVVLKNYPDSPKAADAMLNIASCYSELKDNKKAKATLDALIAKYPDSGAAQTAKDRAPKK